MFDTSLSSHFMHGNWAALSKPGVAVKFQWGWVGFNMPTDTDRCNTCILSILYLTLRYIFSSLDVQDWENIRSDINRLHVRGGNPYEDMIRSRRMRIILGLVLLAFGILAAVLYYQVLGKFIIYLIGFMKELYKCIIMSYVLNKSFLMHCKGCYV